MSTPKGIRRCSVCGLIKRPEELKTCSRCKEPNYLVCSKECQKADWKEHKKWCNKAPPQGKTLDPSRVLDLPGNAVVLVPIMDPDDKLCFVYTRGLHSKGIPELFAIDIPVGMLGKVEELMTAVIKKSRTFPDKNFHGDKVGCENLCGVTFDVKKEYHRRQIIRSMGFCDISAKIRMVKPIFDVWETMAPPTFREEKILAKWRRYREANGPSGSAVLEQALLSTSRTWELCELSSKQIKQVNENWPRFLRLGLGELCMPPLDKAEPFIKDVAANIHLAPQRYRLGTKVAQGNYTWDI